MDRSLRPSRLCYQHQNPLHKDLLGFKNLGGFRLRYNHPANAQYDCHQTVDDTAQK